MISRKIWVTEKLWKFHTVAISFAIIITKKKKRHQNFNFILHMLDYFFYFFQVLMVDPKRRTNIGLYIWWVRGLTMNYGQNCKNFIFGLNCQCTKTPTQRYVNWQVRKWKVFLSVSNEWFHECFWSGLLHTVWKFQKFPATQILREINFRNFGILTHLHRSSEFRLFMKFCTF